MVEMSYRTQRERGSIKRGHKIDPHGVSARHRDRSALAPTGTGLALKGMMGMKVSNFNKKQYSHGLVIP